MLTLTPVTIREAQAYCDRVHRHHKAPRGAVFAVAVSVDGQVRGVAIAGRPVSRILQDGWTLEITRVATDGTPNACSFLYGACRRAALGMGYRRVITYTLATETGASVRAAGFRVVADVRGKTWDCPSRPRVDLNPNQEKIRWQTP